MSIFATYRPFGAPRIHMDEAAAGGVIDSGITNPVIDDTPKEGAITLSQGLRLLRNEREKKPETNTTEQPAAPEKVAAADPVKTEPKAGDPPAEGSAPAVQATGETDEQGKTPPEKAPRPLPRSWTKEQADHWNSLPETVQEFLTEQDKRASEVVRKAQNEAAAKAKDVESRMAAAEQVRTEYEAKAKEAMAVLLREQQRDFSDITSIEAVNKLAIEDPVRYVQWDAHQRQLQAVAADVKAAEEQKANAAKEKRGQYAAAQVAALREAYPEFADVKTYNETLTEALPLLSQYGFDRETLGSWANSDAGHEILQSAGFQRMVVDLMRANKAIEGYKTTVAGHQKEVADLKAKLVPPTTPPVVRPGAAPDRSNAPSATLQSLSRSLTSSGKLDDAVKLLVAKRTSR